jgi:molecular chaperone GrpE
MTTPRPDTGVPEAVGTNRPAAREAPGTPVDAGPTEQAPPAAEAPSETARPSLAEMEDRWLRAIAELENLRKRYTLQLAREQAAERARVATAWLPVLDNLELALEHADAEPGPVVTGVRQVRDQAVNVLAALGYARHEETGVPFDPARHEAVGVVAGADALRGTVLRVLRPGYGEGERQLRPAAVVVAGDRE